MTTANLSLEELTTRTISAGRSIAVDILASDFGGVGHDHALIDRCLRRLAEGVPFDRRDEGGFTSVQDRLRRAVSEETTGTVRTFSGVSDPELGDIGDVIERPLLTERGERLQALSTRFDIFFALRQQVLDRVSAEKFLAGRL